MGIEFPKAEPSFLDAPCTTSVSFGFGCDSAEPGKALGTISGSGFLHGLAKSLFHG